MDLWTQCKERATATSVHGQLIRVVENQEQVATNEIVETLSEQAALERLLEGNKPPPHQDSQGAHYLLSAPFRYPPLRYGSRFGRRHERGIFYGSLLLETALAELAYYRLIFLHDTVIPMDLIASQHSCFQAAYLSSTGIRLQDPPCSMHREHLSHPSDYSVSQDLGSNLREAGFDVIEYQSARSAEGGINIAVLEPKAIVSSTPRRMRPLLCETTPERVTVSDIERHRVFVFELDAFTRDGQLPRPAP